MLAHFSKYKEDIKQYDEAMRSNGPMPEGLALNRHTYHTYYHLMDDVNYKAPEFVGVFEQNERRMMDIEKEANQCANEIKLFVTKLLK